ncbi:MAG: hypothetical protein HC888_07690, partial [Candidatus Competibacteraceae bacterium]|nr:hypothetical protein [Candidatus Competibacteraceae bacterium]
RFPAPPPGITWKTWRIYRDHPWKAAKELVRVHGEESTPCEVMAYWRDALLAGYRPGNAGQYGAAAGDVLLLGIDGGVISTFEYKLAVVLGARVGLVEDRELLALRGGGACSAWKAMTGHSVWNTAPNFYPLPKDPQVLYMFLRMPAAPWPQDASLRTSLAKLAHENYRATVLRTPSVIDQALSAWDDLPKTWRKANVAQVASLQHVLAAAGLLLMPKPEADALLESREYEEVKGPTPREIEVLARLEHARWCVERLAEGWRYGPARDNVRKLRPQLVSWDRLVREQHPIETEKDRAVARGITEALKHLHSGKNTHLLLRRKGNDGHPVTTSDTCGPAHSPGYSGPYPAAAACHGHDGRRSVVSPWREGRLWGNRARGGGA